MKKGLILFTTVFSLFFIGCQKEVTMDLVADNSNVTFNNNNSVIEIIGTWKFISSRVKTVAINEITAGGIAMKTVMTSDYTTENNKGAVVFSGTNMTYDSVSYSINTIAFAKVYENNVLVDTFSVPMQMNIPPTKGQSTFTRVGADSITFAGSGSPLSGASQPSKPGGVKLKKEQDKLFMTQKLNEVSTTTQQGQTVKTTQQAEVVTTLQKQ